MPRFFFDTNDDVDLWDDEGIELPDLDTARRFAIRYAGELLREGPSLVPGETWQLKASDASRSVLFSIDVKVTPTQAALSVPGLSVPPRQRPNGAQRSEGIAHSN